MSNIDQATATANQDILAVMGDLVTYLPVNISIAPFTWLAVVGSPLIDQFEPRIICDRVECEGLHSDLVSHGITEPTASANQDACDRIVTTGPNGEEVAWSIIEKHYEYGMWLLTLEKDIRILSR